MNRAIQMLKYNRAPSLLNTLDPDLLDFKFFCLVARGLSLQAQTGYSPPLVLLL
jgi:hypothetical protein